MTSPKRHLRMSVYLEVPVRLWQQVGCPVVLTATNFSTRFFSAARWRCTLIRCQSRRGHVLTTGALVLVAGGVLRP
jgi:hypothetical protein